MPKKIARNSPTKATIKIPRTLYNRLQEIVDGSGFDSVTDFVVYVLRDLASVNTYEQRDEGDSLSSREIDLIRNRLKSLGYL